MAVRRCLGHGSAALAGVGLALSLFCLGAAAQPAPRDAMENTICRLVERAAGAQALPVAEFVRLIWRESSLGGQAVSHAGASGAVPTMPDKPRAGVAPTPFDPEAAIPSAARYLARLRTRFGNLGLAVAAYQAGPEPVSNWLDRRAELAAETQDYVRFVSGRDLADWVARGAAPAAPTAQDAGDCLTTVAAIRSTAPSLMEGAYAPFGVQLAGNTTKERAVASYRAVVARFPGLLGDEPTLVVGTSLPGRGLQPYYRVRLPRPDARSADEFCGRLRSAGGTCIVLRN